ncbi:CobW family GTP-binding protein [Pigmentiphaga humi]|nr:GTP-binding protein [Pigmentiphaga humi]
MAVKRIPVIVLTGFLGSGKTTLLRALLESGSVADTAVLVNEYGAVGLDHTLMWRAGEVVQVVENGCICCSVSDDLIAMLVELFELRLYRKVPKFQRVVIETTGLADPRSIMQALRAHPLVNERFRLAAVLCTVDATASAASVLRAPEGTPQIAAADRILLTKTDLVDRDCIDAWSAALSRANPAAELSCIRADAFPAGLAGFFEEIPGASLGQRCRENAVAWSLPRSLARSARHSEVCTATIHLPQSVDEMALYQALDELTARFEDRLLRLKGIVRLSGKPQPSVVQAVRSQIFPLESIADFDGPGFLVVILRGNVDDAEWATALLTRCCSGLR